MIKVSICLSDIPKDKITSSTKNEKKYLNIVVDEKKSPDQYGNTHNVYINQTEEERKRKEPKDYIGNGKELLFDNNQTQQQPQSPNSTTDSGDDLPF